MLQALEEELHQRREYLEGKPLESIYFGGGTPSLLSVPEIRRLLDTIFALHPVLPHAEITLEANPDDLTKDTIAALRETPVNRLSIGIQSFYDDELQNMRRIHTAKEGLDSLERAMAAGFHSLTMDLIYGTPLLTESRWVESLARVAALDVPHLSAYQLTIEPKTILAHHINKGISASPDDTATVLQFEMLMDWAALNDYEHYEISNLARTGHRAVHNSNYWKSIPYLGIGPSAHSFDGFSREWNIANNTQYINGIREGSARAGIETLSDEDRYNEYIMTRLRTIEGIDDTGLNAFGTQFFDHFHTSVQSLIAQGRIEQTNGTWKLTRQGKLYADRISAELFVEEER